MSVCRIAKRKKPSLVTGACAQLSPALQELMSLGNEISYVIVSSAGSDLRKIPGRLQHKRPRPLNRRDMHVEKAGNIIKRRLLLGRKVMTNLDSILNSRDITPTKVCLVEAMVFPVVVYGCELDCEEG